MKLSPLYSFGLFLCMATAPLLAQQESSSRQNLSLTNESALSERSNGQYGGGYAHSAYHDKWDKLAFEAGAGFNTPVGNIGQYLTWGYNVNVGAGYKFNPHWEALLEYQFVHDKLPGSLIADVGATGGYANMWSFTLDPVFYVRRTDKAVNNLYFTGGGGFYRKVTSFTDPQYYEYCDYFYGYCGLGVSNVVVGHFSSNQGGVNVGMGVTHKVGERAMLFAEARYTWLNTPKASDDANGLGTTGLIPVTFGVRW